MCDIHHQILITLLGTPPGLAQELAKARCQRILVYSAQQRYRRRRCGRQTAAQRDLVTLVVHAGLKHDSLRRVGQPKRGSLRQRVRLCAAARARRSTALMRAARPL